MVLHTQKYWVLFGEATEEEQSVKRMEDGLSADTNTLPSSTVYFLVEYKIAHKQYSLTIPSGSNRFLTSFLFTLEMISFPKLRGKGPSFSNPPKVS